MSVRRGIVIGCCEFSGQDIRRAAVGELTPGDGTWELGTEVMMIEMSKRDGCLEYEAGS